MRDTTTPPTPLRRVLLLDAAASGALGLLLVVAAGALAAPLGLPRPLLLLVGAGLVPFAGALVLVATRRPIPGGAARTIVVANVAWVLASVGLLAGPWVAPTALGEAFVLAQAGAVAALTVLEHRALRTPGARGARPASA